MSHFIYQLYYAVDIRDDKKVYLLVRQDADNMQTECALLSYGTLVDAIKSKTRANPEYYQWEPAGMLKHFLYMPSGLLSEWAIGGKL